MAGPLDDVPALIEHVGTSPELIVDSALANWGIAVSLDLLAAYLSVPSASATELVADLEASGLDASFATASDPVDE